MPLETRETKLFWRDIPGFCRDIPEAPEKFEKKKFVFNFRSLAKGDRQEEFDHFSCLTRFWSLFLTPLFGEGLRCNTIRGNRTESLWKGSLVSESEGFQSFSRGFKRVSEIFERFSEIFERSSEVLSETLSEADFPLRGSQSCCPYSCCPLNFLQSVTFFSPLLFARLSRTPSAAWRRTFDSEMPSVQLGIPWRALRGCLRNHFWKETRPQPY